MDLARDGVEFNESIAAAVCREVFEEAGYKVEVGHILAEHHFTVSRRTGDRRPLRSQRFVLAASIAGGELGTTEEGGTTDFARWVPLGEVSSLQPRADIIDVATNVLLAFQPAPSCRDVARQSLSKGPRLAHFTSYPWLMGTEPTAQTLRLRAALRRHRAGLVEVLDKYGATNPRLFGSVARGDARDDSDLDLLVDLTPGAGNELLRVAGLAEELSELLGVRVDVVATTLLRGEVSATAFEDAMTL